MYIIYIHTSIKHVTYTHVLFDRTFLVKTNEGHQNIK